MYHDVVHTLEELDYEKVQGIYGPMNMTVHQPQNVMTVKPLQVTDRKLQ
jgi:hypothetical protein